MCERSTGDLAAAVLRDCWALNVRPPHLLGFDERSRGCYGELAIRSIDRDGRSIERERKVVAARLEALRQLEAPDRLRKHGLRDVLGIFTASCPAPHVTVGLLVVAAMCCFRPPSHNL